MSTNKSEHLQLHLWEPGDSVLRTEFNENWEKIDGETARLDAAVAAAEESVPLVKLAELQLTQAAQSFVLDLAGKDLGRFRALELVIDNACAEQGSGVSCRVNGNAGGYYNTNGNSVWATSLSIGSLPWSAYGRGSLRCEITDTGEHLAFSSESFGASSNGTVSRGTTYAVCKGYCLQDITTLTLYSSDPDTGTVKFLSGLRLALYGKKW